MDIIPFPSQSSDNNEERTRRVKQLEKLLNALQTGLGMELTKDRAKIYIAALLQASLPIEAIQEAVFSLIVTLPLTWTSPRFPLVSEILDAARKSKAMQELCQAKY